MKNKLDIERFDYNACFPDKLTKMKGHDLDGYFKYACRTGLCIVCNL